MSFFCLLLDTNQEEHKASKIMLKPAGVDRRYFKQKRLKSVDDGYYLPVIAYPNPSLPLMIKILDAYPCWVGLSSFNQPAGQRQTTRLNPPETENIFATSSYDQLPSVLLSLCDSQNIQNMSMLNKYSLTNLDEPRKQVIPYNIGETNIRDEDQRQKNDYILNGTSLQNCYFKLCYPEKIFCLPNPYTEKTLKSYFTQQVTFDNKKEVDTKIMNLKLFLEKIMSVEHEYERFRQLMKETHNVKIDFNNSALENKTWWPSMYKRIKQKERGKINQYALAGVCIKKGNDITLVAEDIKPYHHRNRKQKSEKRVYSKSMHSEEIAIEGIDEFLLRNNDKVVYIFIHTYYSPCLSCLILLLTKAYEWNSKYGCCTFVTWTLPWGLQGDIFTKDLTYSQLDSLNNVSYPIDCKGIKFILNNRKLGGIRQKLNEIVSKAKDKKKTKEKTDRLANELKEQTEKYETRQEHLKNGRHIVKSFVNYPPNDLLLDSQSQRYILQDWKKAVNSSELPLSATEKLNPDFKINEVKLIYKCLESFKNCPLKLSRLRKPV